LRKLKIFFVTLICLLSSNIAFTLGVGDIKVNSALNQPLDAEIKLFSLRPGEADNIRVTLGTLKDFANAGIDRPLVLSDLKFRVIDNKDGSASVKVTSIKPIKEPFLDFLVEVDWSGGRLIREYTMLLDPPVFAQRKAAPVQAPVAQAPAASMKATPAPRTMAPATASAPGASAAITDNSGELFPRIELGGETAAVTTRAPVATSGENYKVRKNDTLWSIATSLRPDSSITTEQMMMALLRSNPQAFTDGNINGLKSGFILRVPERDMIDAINSAEAIRQTREQNELWRNARETISRGETPTGTQGEASKSEQASPAVTADSGVKLVTPRQTDASSSAQGAGGEDNSSEQLALYTEQLASKELENADLKGRLGALQDQLESMGRLLTLTEESLADLQGKLGEQAATPAEPAPVAAEPEVKPTPAATKPTGNKSANRFALDDIVQAEIPAPKPVTAKPQARVATPAAPPAANEGIFGFVKEMLNNVAVIGVLVVVVIGLLAMIWLVQRRRMAAAQFPESILTGRPATSSGTESSVAEETSLLSDFAPSAMSGAIESEIGEVDPLSEADVYIAYNKHQQAEELLTSAIEQEPDRLDRKLKLMEVYYSAKNSDAFLALASEVNAAKGDQNAALWGKAVEMGRELFPDNDLFRDNSTLDVEDDFSDLQDLAELDDIETDFNTTGTEESPTLDIQEIEEPASEFDLDMSALDEVDTESGSAGGSDEDDLSLDFDMPEAEEETDTSSGLGELDLSAFEEDTDDVVAKDEPPVTEFDAAGLDMGMLDETEEAPAEEN